MTAGGRVMLRAEPSPPMITATRGFGSEALAQSVGACVGLGGLAAGGTWLALTSASSDKIVDTSSAPEPNWAHGLLAGSCQR